MLYTITKVVTEPDYHVRLTYASGETIVIDCTPYIQRGGVFVPLKDQSFFAQVALGERGRYIQWPGEIELCADALWLTYASSNNTQDTPLL